MNSSVDETNPAPAPITANGSNPRPPTPSNALAPRAPAPVPIAILGNAFLSIFLVLSLNIPCSPKSAFCILSLFLANPIADPIAKPAIGPRPVTAPKIVPVIPRAFISGRYFFIISWVSCENNPPFLLVLPSAITTFSPKSCFCKNSEFDTILTADPSTAPTNGPPRSVPATPPTTAPPAASGRCFFTTAFAYVIFP